MTAEEEVESRRRRVSLPLRRPRWATVFVGFILVAILLIFIIWTQRRQLATDYLQRELERRGVHATYRVTRIGFRTERIEDVVIGNPARPDLTAKWVEVHISWGLRSPKVSLIRARGVRLFGGIVKRKITFGEVDKLLPKPTGKPFEFPDIAVDVADSAIALDTPAGRIAMALEGQGNLANGFKGVMAARSTKLLLGKCAIETPTVYAKIAIAQRRPSITGPVRAERMVCPGAGVDLASPILSLDANVSETLNSWKGNAGLQVQHAQIGKNSAAGVNGRVTFDGRKKLTRGTMDLTALEARVGDFTSARTNLQGRYAISLANGNLSLLGNASAKGIRGGGAAIRPIVAALASADGTPIGPIGNALSRAVARAAEGFDASGTLRLVNAPRYGAVRVETLSATSRSGANLGLNGGEGMTFYWPAGQPRVDGQFGLSGGGFPSTILTLSQPRGAPMRGEARIAPMVAGNARLSLAPVRFLAAKGGNTRIETAALLSGPFKDGYVRNLSLPIAGTFGNGGFAFGEGCVAVRFDALQATSLRLGPTRLPMCPTGRALVWKTRNGPIQGGADIKSVRLAGRLGQSPITMVSDRVRFALGDPSFTSSNVRILLGPAGVANRLNVATLAGRFNARGVEGTFAGAAGKLAAVPLLTSDGHGAWRVIGGKVAVEGAVTVADEMNPPRFYPLVSNDFHLTMIDNQIEAGGWLNDPETGTRVTEVAIDHSLRTGTGHASLAVPGITFTPDGYQPEQLTRLTTGVVALVDGTVNGQGQINWSRQGTTSTGSFSTTKMNLAAPFGPVEGLTTTINFTDLLGLVSAPGQEAHVDLIRTGIDVIDGNIRYQTLRDSHIRVESGRWPFMGGQLLLDDTILDFSKPSTKKLTFHVEGLDAQTFVQTMEFANIDATGIFDGVIPMEFDETGGRIVGGRLIARPPGGTLSYIGIVTEQAMGAYGKMAFDALKSLRYDKFTINLDGSLEGEFLAGIELDGIARNTARPKGIAGYVIGQLAKLRFEFNINIRGPFRSLIGTARSFNDPSILIQPILPQELQGLPIEVIKKVQDKQSTTTGGDATTTKKTTIQGQESEGVK